MKKNSDAKRRAKLKERRNRAQQHTVLMQSKQAKVAEWIAAHDAEPNVIADLVDDHGISLCRVEGRSDDDWIVIVGDEPTAGSNDAFTALGMLLNAAVDDREHGDESYIQFSAWLVEEIEARCEATEMELEEFLRSLLPVEKRRLALPRQRAL